MCSVSHLIQAPSMHPPLYVSPQPLRPYRRHSQKAHLQLASGASSLTYQCHSPSRGIECSVGSQCPLGPTKGVRRKKSIIAQRWQCSTCVSRMSYQMSNGKFFHLTGESLQDTVVRLKPSTPCKEPRRLLSKAWPTPGPLQSPGAPS